jgi:putative heme-binding domain-containing protein
MEAIADGSVDKWFRPSDVCVAPDGSVIVADWYDPGVGGHGMGDIEKGRLYRIAPKGSRWSVPKADFSTVAGAVAALASPNHCTRATALERLAKEPEAAAAALEKQLAKPNDERHAARMAWATGMLPGRSVATVQSLLASSDPGMRIIGLRMCRLTKGDVIGCVEKLVADPSAAVRREAALALKGVSGDRANRAWAELASRHKAGDRWELEALGIGADGQWDGRLESWLVKTSGPKDPAGREIVWRSRGARSAAMQCLLIADANVTTAESLALLRALDFQERVRTAAAVRETLRREPRGQMGAEEKLRVILPELVLRLEPGDAADPVIATRIGEAADYAEGSRQLVEIVQRFGLKDRTDDLVSLAAAESAAGAVAAAAAGIAVEGGGEGRVKAALAGDKAAALRLLDAIGIRGSGRTTGMLEGLIADAGTTVEMKAAAVRALARSQSGAKKLITLAKDGRLSGVLPQVAAVAIASTPWSDVRQAAAEVLPMPKGKGGEKLPPVAEFVKRQGNADRGKALFAGAGTCAKCHIVNGEGKSVGPNLSGVGAKLSREALYESVLAPSAAISHSYETHTALLEDGRSITGLLVSQSPKEVVIRGADGIDVTVPAADVEQLVKQPVSLMPADLAATLSAEELVDVVAWMETLRSSQ